MLRSGMIHSLLFTQILTGNIILRHLVRMNLHFVIITGVFHALHNIGFECVFFLEQLIHTLRICKTPRAHRFADFEVTGQYLGLCPSGLLTASVFFLSCASAHCLVFAARSE